MTLTVWGTVTTIELTVPDLRRVCRLVIDRLPPDSLVAATEWLAEEYEDSRTAALPPRGCPQPATRATTGRFLGRVSAPYPSLIEVD